MPRERTGQGSGERSAADAADALVKLRRRTGTRDALLLAGRALLAAEWRCGFTIDDIVRKAGVAKGSFYNHFADKEALTCEVRRRIREREEIEIAAVNRSVRYPAARIAHAMALYARLALTSPEEARIITLGQVSAISLDSPVNAGLLKDLREGLRSGDIVVPSVRAGAMLVMGQTATLMSHLIGQKERTYACDLSQQCIALALLGLGLEHKAAHRLSAQAVEAIFGSVPPERQAMHHDP